MSNQLIKETSQGFEKIFPKNYIQNLKDKDSGKVLSEILKSFNMLFLNYTDNKSNTRKQVPVSLRHGGLWITYIIDKNGSAQIAIIRSINGLIIFMYILILVYLI